jgi:hypothetical protein
VSVTTEVYRRIYDDQDGTFLNVSPDSDGIGTVTVWPSNEDSRRKYFPGVMLQIQDEEMAKALVEAINLCAVECAAIRLTRKP